MQMIRYMESIYKSVCLVTAHLKNSIKVSLSLKTPINTNGFKY